MVAINSHHDATCSSLYEQRVLKTGSLIIMGPQNQPEAMSEHLVTLSIICPEMRTFKTIERAEAVILPSWTKCVDEGLIV